jgi:hypothetical protein
MRIPIPLFCLVLVLGTFYVLWSVYTISDNTGDYAGESAQYWHGLASIETRALQRATDPWPLHRQLQFFTRVIHEQNANALRYGNVH